MSAPFCCDAGIIAILARWAEAGTRDGSRARYFGDAHHPSPLVCTADGMLLR